MDEEGFLTSQDYHPRLRPLVHSGGAVLAQKVNGRWYSLAPDIRRHEKPDYALWPEGEKPLKGMKVLAKKTFGKKKKRTFFLYGAGKKDFDKKSKR
jgi:hypothetical protein